MVGFKGARQIGEDNADLKGRARSRPQTQLPHQAPLQLPAPTQGTAQDPPCRTVRYQPKTHNRRHREHTISAEMVCILQPGGTTDWQVSVHNSTWPHRHRRTTAQAGMPLLGTHNQEGRQQFMNISTYQTKHTQGRHDLLGIGPLKCGA